MADIDLNCDLGEGAGHDHELMPLITSASIACAAHAGDPLTMVATMNLAKEHGVRVGAHPGYFDRKHFGRRELDLPYDQLVCESVYQIGALMALANLCDCVMEYVKPHGGLYNRACRENFAATAVMAAALRFGLPVLALPESNLEAVCKNGGVGFVREGFADRRYTAGGLLVPRTEPGAFVHDPDEAVKQAERLIESHAVRSLCVHGDNPDAVRFVINLREALLNRGHRIVSFA